MLKIILLAEQIGNDYFIMSMIDFNIGSDNFYSISKNVNKMANIKIYSYLPGTALLISSDGSEILSHNDAGNWFSVTDESGIEYTINADGTLTEKTTG